MSNKKVELGLDDVLLHTVRLLETRSEWSCAFCRIRPIRVVSLTPAPHMCAKNDALHVCMPCGCCTYNGMQRIAFAAPELLTALELML